MYKFNMRELFFIAWLTTYISQALAYEVYPFTFYGFPLETFYACQYLMYNTATFCDNEYLCFYSDPNALATLSGCLSYDGRNTSSILSPMLSAIKENYDVTITVEQMAEAYINYTLYAKYPSEIDGFNSSITVNVPIKLNESLIQLYEESFKILESGSDNAVYFFSGVLGYWLLIMIIAAIANWSVVIFPGIINYFVGPISNALQKHILLPAFLYKKKLQEKKVMWIFSGLIPSRFESLVIFGFVGLIIGNIAQGVYYNDGNPVYPIKSQAITSYIGNNTGIVATSLLPLLILFAGRNNFLQWVTRWNFATFITYHRWIARVEVALAFIHGVAESIRYVTYNDYPLILTETYVIWGTIALVAGCVILFQGMLYFRRKLYEVFLLIHIILAVLYVVGMWYHVLTLGYGVFAYPSFAVWMFDRLVRIGRLLIFGFPKAEVKLIADEVVKVSIPKPKYWKEIPGGHAFIHFLRPSCFWQSHPFTFVGTENDDKIIMYCKVKGGVTHGLYKYLSVFPEKKTYIRVGLEGPYGSPTLAKGYNTAVFLAGGNGIPGLYSEVTDLARRSKDNIKQSLKLIWIVRDYKSLIWFYDELKSLQNTKIQTTIYITRPRTNEGINLLSKTLAYELINDEEKMKHTFGEKASSEELSNTHIKDLMAEEFPSISFEYVRPTIDEIISQEIKESLGSTAFIACGHAAMVDDVRYSVVDNIGKTGGKRIDFYEQLQVWT